MQARTRARRAAAFMAAAALVVGYLNPALPSAAGGIPDIGGTPIHVEEDVFAGSAVEVLVYSYVYHGAGGALPPGFDPPLAQDESLFAYFIINTGMEDADVLALDNPSDISIHAVGTSTIIPPDADPLLRNDPNEVQAGLDAVQYAWTHNPDIGLELLHPGEWAVTFFRSFGFWQPVMAFAGNFGIGDFDIQDIPGPAIIPEPSSLSLCLLALVGLLRRPRRTD